jgi:hypothetical protein
MDGLAGCLTLTAPERQTKHGPGWREIGRGTDGAWEALEAGFGTSRETGVGSQREFEGAVAAVEIVQHHQHQVSVRVHEDGLWGYGVAHST